jgi:hypothetical protein
LGLEEHRQQITTATYFFLAMGFACRHLFKALSHVGFRECRDWEGKQLEPKTIQQQNDWVLQE